MRLPKSGYSLVMLLAVIALGIYLIKYDVQSIRDENASMRASIAAEREALQLLEAEWAYLNRPDRLAALAEKYLELKPMDALSVATLADVPLREEQVAALPEVR